MTMGSEAAPVNIWLWQADGLRGYEVIARAISTTLRRDPGLSGLECHSLHAQGHWQIVFTRPLKADGVEFVDLSGRRRVGVAFAVWEGSNRERGPLKAFSGEFQDLTLGG
jgi:complex iron-sulfur molybdoenzyme family reductase subunit gamma